VNEKWLTPEDVAGELRIGKMTIYRMLDAGTIPAYRFGRLYRVRPEDLKAYISDSRVPAKAAAEDA
jgi:excisionase family DNA binding protein